jgi:hypothetical protein
MNRFILCICLFLSFLYKTKAAEQLDVNDPKWNWMDKQIEEDFRPYQKSGITLQMIDQTLKSKKIDWVKRIHRLQIINGKVYGPDFFEIKKLLEKVLEIYHVPNVDILALNQDLIRNPWSLRCPVLCMGRRGNHPKAIHFPHGLWKKWEKNIEPVNTACSLSPWELKVPKIFWRGTAGDRGQYNDPNGWIHKPRGYLCYLSQKYPELIDAGFRSIARWKINKNLLDEFWSFFPYKKYASWAEYVNYKYQIDLDGVCATWPSYKWKLLSNCAVFKQNSSYTLWFHKALSPWVHYIPVESNISDIFEKLDWAKTHDAEAKKIADNSTKFAKENLMPEHIYLYCYKVLLKWASLQKFRPRICQ